MKKAEPILQTRATLGEGPIWDGDKRVLYWVDIPAKRLFIYNPATGLNDAIELGADVSAVVPRRSGGVIVTLPNGFAHVDLESRKVSIVAEVEADIPSNRFNHGYSDPAGRVWAGTMAYDKTPGAGSLYRLDTDHTVHRMLTGVTISNGMVWTADRKTMYYIDTPAQRIDAFDYDPEAGSISNRRVAVHVSPDHGAPDGMAIDELDTVWVAMAGGGRVCRFDPLHDKLMQTIEVPGAKQVTACAFGGERLDELYITSGSEDFSEADWEQQPLAGALFMVHVDIRGVPAQPYLG